MKKQISWTAFIALLLIAIQTPALNERTDKIRFNDLRAQTIEFIAYNKSIKLTQQQEEIKQKVLSSIAAPCCSEFSIATCCCPCNLAKSVWGLSNYLLAKKNYTASQLRVAVLDWLMFTNKGAYAGDACSKGRCGQPFKNDGCGGMQEENVSF